MASSASATIPEATPVFCRGLGQRLLHSPEVARPPSHGHGLPDCCTFEGGHPTGHHHPQRSVAAKLPPDAANHKLTYRSSLDTDIRALRKDFTGPLKHHCIRVHGEKHMARRSISFWSRAARCSRSTPSPSARPASAGSAPPRGKCWENQPRRIGSGTPVLSNTYDCDCRPSSTTWAARSTATGTAAATVFEPATDRVQARRGCHPVALECSAGWPGLFQQSWRDRCHGLRWGPIWPDWSSSFG